MRAGRVGAGAARSVDATRALSSTVVPQVIPRHCARGSSRLSRRGRNVARLLLLATLAAAYRPAIAADDEEAKGHYEKATAAYALGHFGEAAEHYEKAFALKPDPALLYNAAQAYRRAGNRERALALYTSYLQVFPNGPNTEVAARWAQELKATLAAERARAPAPAPAPVALAPAPAAPAPRAQRSLVKRPWFWVAAGAVVAGSALTLALTSRGTKDPEPTFGAVGGP
jgi:tetratricopeptide (TPR) repeat protein